MEKSDGKVSLPLLGDASKAEKWLEKAPIRKQQIVADTASR